MEIRAYTPADCQRTAALFYDTVHAVACRDYSQEQLDAWAPEDRDLTVWDQSFQGHFALVAVEGETLLGFGDITPTGYLDRLYVHQDHLRQGIATALRKVGRPGPGADCHPCLLHSPALFCPEGVSFGPGPGGGAPGCAAYQLRDAKGPLMGRVKAAVPLGGRETGERPLPG